MNTLSPAALAALLVLVPGGALAAHDPGHGTGPAAAGEAAGLIFDARLRSETVRDDAAPLDGHALTLRTRLGWRSPTIADLQLLVEADGVAVLDDRYSAPTAHMHGRPHVHDGEEFELNRAQLRWTGLPDSEVTIGRQRLTLMGGRLVNAMGWRQNEQTFDAVSVSTRALEPLTLSYAWAGRVRRPLGDSHPQGVWRGDVHMLQAEAATPAGRLRGFGLAIDLENAPMQSSATWGADLAGDRALGEDLALTWSAGYARQSEHGDNPGDFALDYHAASVGLRGSRWAASIGGERLDGDGVHSFQTPLGGGHHPLGWSDVIMATPAFGVRDLYVRGQVEVDPPLLGRPVRLSAEAHDFHDASGSFRLGRELDAAAAVAINPRWSAEVKAARFESEHAAFSDASKLWLSLEYRY